MQIKMYCQNILGKTIETLKHSILRNSQCYKIKKTDKLTIMLMTHHLHFRLTTMIK